MKKQKETPKEASTVSEENPTILIKNLTLKGKIANVSNDIALNKSITFGNDGIAEVTPEAYAILIKIAGFEPV